MSPLFLLTALAVSPTPWATPGCPIYEGTVRKTADTAVLYRYRRHELHNTSGTTSTHLTTTPEGLPVVLHQADHGLDHTLRTFCEVHDQTGTTAEVDVVGDRVHFRTTHAGRTRRRVARIRNPLVVGPTLFGFLQAHPDQRRVDVVVPQLRRSIGLSATREEDEAGTTFVLRARSPLFRLIVPPMRVTFDADGTVVRYTGRVPPLERVGHRLRPLDAVVTYVPAPTGCRRPPDRGPAPGSGSRAPGAR